MGSMRNQEKLWKAQTADATQRKKEDEMDKRREEEMQVEALRKQMYLHGQAKATDLPSFSGMSEASSSKLPKNSDQYQALQTQKLRRAQVKEEQARKEQALADPAVKDELEADDGGPDIPDAMVTQEEERELVNSRYKEDVHVRGHCSVWGSWFEVGEKKWGFICCKSTSHMQRCPLAPEVDPEEENKPKRARGEPRGKRRKRGGRPEDAESVAVDASRIDAPLNDGL